MASSAYESLKEINEKTTVYVLRVAFAFLSAAALFSAVATLTYLKADMTPGVYVAGLSTIINLVAAWHYNELIKVRMGQSISVASEWKMDSLRHSDWAVTMPLLVLKLYALINNPDHDMILNTIDASALCATIMILLGAYARLGLDELADFERMSNVDRATGIACYAGSVALLIVLLIDLAECYSGVNNTFIVFSFFLVWPCYAITALSSVLFRQQGQSYPKTLALSKDLVYAALDVFSKAVFAWHTCSAAFGVQVLGS